MPAMEPLVRPARPDDPGVVELLYLSAAPYYDAFAGGPERARALLEALYRRPRHAASFDCTHVAESGGTICGAMALFPAREGDPLARRFLRLAFVRIPPWRWPRTAAHLRAASSISPVPAPDSLYIDALAVAAGARRQGMARALLGRAEALARECGCGCVSLDTGVDNHDARSTYEACGFELRSERLTADDRVARAVGGRGFVSYVKRV